MNWKSINWKSTLAATALMLSATSALAAANPQLDADILKLQQNWAHIKYEVKGEDQQGAQMARLADNAAAVAHNYPGTAEPLIWQAIILSSEAGIKGGLGALGLVKDARKLLEQAEKIDPRALDGSAMTSLASLYYQVPGFPIGFGDKDKAARYFQKALAINPDGLDPNFFYGDYLIRQGRYAQAVTVLEHALQAPARPSREVADRGRREEVRQLLDQAHAKLGR